MVGQVPRRLRDALLLFDLLGQAVRDGRCLAWHVNADGRSASDRSERGGSEHCEPHGTEGRWIEENGLP